MNIFKSRIFQFTLLLLLFGGIAGTLLYIHQKEVYPTRTAQPAPIPSDGIVDFNYERDHEFINSVFADDDNWYWLVEGDRSVFSAEEMMQTLSSSAKDPRSKGNLTIKILYVDGKPAGFLAYYMKKFYQGQIRFVFVDKKYRGSGYGLKLVDYAVDDLVSRGATKITLVTRSSNLPAQRIYQKASFEVERAPEGFVYFVKKVE